MAAVRPDFCAGCGDPLPRDTQGGLLCPSCLLWELLAVDVELRLSLFAQARGCNENDRGKSLARRSVHEYLVGNGVRAQHHVDLGAVLRAHAASCAKHRVNIVLRAVAQAVGLGTAEGAHILVRSGAGYAAGYYLGDAANRSGAQDCPQCARLQQTLARMDADITEHGSLLGAALAAHPDIDAGSDTE